AVWIVPVATPDGVRFGLCRGDRAGWCGPIYKDVRVESSAALVKASGRSSWLLIQSADSTWSAVIPGPSPGGIVFDNLPPIKGQPTLSAALAAGEKQMAEINATNKRYAQEAMARAQKMDEEFRARQAAMAERER